MIEFFTSRFGEMIPDERPETPVITALIGMLAAELCFVGTYDRKLGVIMELEFDDGVDMSQATREAWHKIDVPNGVRLATPPPGNRDFAIFQDRAALWAFVPADIATLELMERITSEAERIANLEDVNAEA
jgi:hypothetical protein